MKLRKIFLSAGAMLPLALFAENFWIDPGFEEWDAVKNQPAGKLSRWRAFEKCKKQTLFEKTSKEKHSGNFSLHIKDTNAGNLNQGLTFVISGKKDLQKIAGKILRFSAWIKQTNASNGRNVGLGIHVICLENGKRKTAGSSAGTGSNGPTGWIQVKTKVKVPEHPQTIYLSLNCANGFHNTGEAYFDDILVTTDAPAAETEGLVKPDVKSSPFKENNRTPEEKAYRESYRNQKPAVEDNRERPVIKNGIWYFHGKPTFFAGVWLYKQKYKDWPGNALGINHFAYKQGPCKEVFEKMGFNSSQISAAHTLQAAAIHGLDLPLKKKNVLSWKEEEKKIEEYYRDFGDFPLVLDFAFGYWKSYPASIKKELDQCNGSWHNFIPFCPEHPDGDSYYRDYFLGGTRAAMRYGANIYLYELFNESSYNCQCRFNLYSFAKKMQQKYGSIARANKVWGTIFDSWADLASRTNLGQYRKLWPDWCKFSEERYVEILKKYQKVIRSADRRKNIYFTEQPSGIGRVGMDYRKNADALDVVTIEGGWGYGFATNYQAKNDMEAVVATGKSRHFFVCDFFSAVAKGKKPVNDHEHYCTRFEHGIRVPSRREDMITSLWLEAMHGVSSSYTYVWDKRSFEARTMEQAKRNVMYPSYKCSSLLNPFNWPPDQLDAFKLFRQELEPYAEKVLPYPRTKPATVAVFFSYPTFRMQEYLKSNYVEKIQKWYGELLNHHYPSKIVFEEEIKAGLPGIQALVIPGSIYADPSMLPAMDAFAKRGGLVIVSDDSMEFDEYSNPLSVRKKYNVVKTPEGVITLLDVHKVKRYGELLPADGKARFTHSDIQITDRGDFKLLCMVSLGNMESRLASVKLHLSDAKNANERFYLYNASRKQLILNGKQETWSLAELEKGFRVILPPQERVIVTLEKKKTPGAVPYPEEQMKKDLASEVAKQMPHIREFYRIQKQKRQENAEGRVYKDVKIKKCIPLDLRKAVNMAFQDDVAGDRKGGWTDQGGNDFANMPLGAQIFSGIPFEIIDPKTNNGKSAVVLWGSERSYFPERSPKIKVGKRAGKIYFLHTMAWNGKHVMSYIVRYRDGRIPSLEIPVYGKRNIATFWGATLLPEAKIAVESHNLQKPQISMYAYAWKNPHPETEIESIEIKSMKTQAVPIVAAITIEQP